MKNVSENVLIKNVFLRVEINPFGAEMQSIRGNDGTEYLWQGDAVFWTDRAPNLFPYIGRMTNGIYRYQGKEYQMGIHGFVLNSELAVAEKTEKSVRFVLEANDRTRKEYPFEFRYSIEYALEGSEIRITYRVENMDEKEMYFAVGGHPGFRMPVGGQGTYEDCYLEFAEKAEPYKIGLSERAFVLEEERAFPLEEGIRLPMRQVLADRDDTIILREMSRSVTLRSAKTEKYIRVEYPQMNYLGIWHWVHPAADYLCIEPWSSLPSREGIVEDIEKQENLISLGAGKIYENTWKIGIGQ